MKVIAVLYTLIWGSCSQWFHDVCCPVACRWKSNLL